MVQSFGLLYFESTLSLASNKIFSFLIQLFLNICFLRGLRTYLSLCDIFKNLFARKATLRFLNWESN